MDKRVWCGFCDRLVWKKEIVAKKDGKKICVSCLNASVKIDMPNRAVPSGRLMSR